MLEIIREENINMKHIMLDEQWEFRRGLGDSLGALEANPCTMVNLPHDGMISLPVKPDAPAASDSGYFPGDVCNYTKYVFIPDEWSNECIGLKFDGVMMHATVEINGCRLAMHHYGYSPFYVDITDYVSFGEENRITININTGVQPSSRWYTGSGLYRGVILCHGPKVHIAADGINVYTKEVSDNMAFLEAEIDICNDSKDNRLVDVSVCLVKEEKEVADEQNKDRGDDCKIAAKVHRLIHVGKEKGETARLSIILDDPLFWSAEEPNLYKVKVTAVDTGIFRTHFVENETKTVDECSSLFGIRTITADAVRGLRINGKTVKLKGGCVHHDNGLLGAVSLYESEARKVMRLKQSGFNAIRTAHNPPSAALVEACDRLGMYIFDEAFDAWGIAKRTGDFSQYFDSFHENELEAFVRRDRIHPSVIMWSIGNEIPERGGLNNGYALATKLVNIIKKLDATRPVSNGICSLWAGLDDYEAKGQNQSQNAKDKDPDIWEKHTEPFTNGLDVVGYNYMEELYERDHELFPERVILGSENFPKEIGYRWPVVEALPYVIGDFTWTAWDYIGEAGIGKAAYVDACDPLIERGPWALMPGEASPFPWRLANDADYDITGRLLPQGAYRRVVWGSKDTWLFSMHPDNYKKTEIISMWGFPAVLKNWNYEGYEGKHVELVVFSAADEVEIILNGQSQGKKPVEKTGSMPRSVKFDLIYEPGVVEAISYVNGQRQSGDKLVTSGKPAKLIVTPERHAIKADGHDLVYVNIDIADEMNRIVTDASVKLNVSLSGEGFIAGFGTGNPVTDEDYTENETISFRGHASAIIRSGYKAGKAVLTVTAPDMEKVQLQIEIIG